MTRAYSEVYLKNAKEVLAGCLDYLIDDCGTEPDLAAFLFVSSGYAARFECGDPAVVSGMSGVELGQRILRETYQDRELPAPRTAESLSPEYWTGWILAEYQWASGRSFKDIFEHVRLSQILQMYLLYHEADSSLALEELERRCLVLLPECRLKKLREARGYSQAELSVVSGVSLRSIQMYEQRVNDIDKAQAHTVCKLSRALGCSMEDLLENPMR